MQKMKLLLEQLKYNQWAVHHYITTAEQLDVAQLERKLNSSFSSIHETLGHMVWVEELWFERWYSLKPSIRHTIQL
jgi:uncharacterized damage-inducible protein DinB